MRRAIMPTFIVGVIFIIFSLSTWFLLPAWPPPPFGLWGKLGVGAIGLICVGFAWLRSRGTASKSASVSSTPPVSEGAAQSTATFASTFSPRMTILPAPADFCGRESELQLLRENFDRGVLLSSAEGSAGVGLTVLARRLAQDLAPRFPDGCLEIDLQGAAPVLVEPLDPVEAQRRLLRPFYGGDPLPEDAKKLNKLYRDTFSKNTVLLLLDNSVGETQLRWLLPRKPSAAIVTSRLEFALSRGKLYPLSLKGLPPGDSLKLLTAVSPHLAKESQKILHKIVERFKYNPLALRLSAALLREPFNWTPRSLLRRSEEARKRLTALHSANNPDIQANVALDLIYEVLSVEQRTYFEMLAVFPSSFKMAAAAAVWGLKVKETDEMLIALTRCNLLDYHPDADTYVLHDLTRLYVQELLLGQPGRARRVITLYAEYYLKEAVLASDYYRAGATRSKEGTRHLAAIWPHLWNAWERVSHTRSGWPPPKNADRWLCDFPIKLQAMLPLVLPLDDRLRVFSHALKSAHRLGERPIEGQLLSLLGGLYAIQDDHERALECHEQHLQIAYELQDRPAEAVALMNVGSACGALGNVHRARESWRQSLALFDIIDEARAQRVRLWLSELERRVGS